MHCLEEWVWVVFNIKNRYNTGSWSLHEFVFRIQLVTILLIVKIKKAWLSQLYCTQWGFGNHAVCLYNNVIYALFPLFKPINSVVNPRLVHLLSTLLATVYFVIIRTEAIVIHMQIKLVSFKSTGSVFVCKNILFLLQRVFLLNSKNQTKFP